MSLLAIQRGADASAAQARRAYGSVSGLLSHTGGMPTGPDEAGAGGR